MYADTRFQIRGAVRWADDRTCLHHLRLVHTGDYSRRKLREIVAENVFAVFGAATICRRFRRRFRRLAVSGGYSRRQCRRGFRVRRCLQHGRSVSEEINLVRKKPWRKNGGAH